MSVFALRLPDDLKAEAAAQAGKAGLSLNQYIASAHVGAQAEAERYITLRGARATPRRSSGDSEPGRYRQRAPR